MIVLIHPCVLHSLDLLYTISTLKTEDFVDVSDDACDAICSILDSTVYNLGSSYDEELSKAISMTTATYTITSSHNNKFKSSIKVLDHFTNNNILKRYEKFVTDFHPTEAILSLDFGEIIDFKTLVSDEFIGDKHYINMDTNGFYDMIRVFKNIKDELYYNFKAMCEKYKSEIDYQIHNAYNTTILESCEYAMERVVILNTYIYEAQYLITNFLDKFCDEIKRISTEDEKDNIDVQ